MIGNSLKLMTLVKLEMHKETKGRRSSTPDPTFEQEQTYPLFPRPKLSDPKIQFKIFCITLSRTNLKEVPPYSLLTFSRRGSMIKKEKMHTTCLSALIAGK